MAEMLFSVLKQASLVKALGKVGDGLKTAGPGGLNALGSFFENAKSNIIDGITGMFAAMAAPALKPFVDALAGFINSTDFAKLATDVGTLAGNIGELGLKLFDLMTATNSWISDLTGIPEKLLTPIGAFNEFFNFLSYKSTEMKETVTDAMNGSIHVWQLNIDKVGEADKKLQIFNTTLDVLTNVLDKTNQGSTDFIRGLTKMSDLFNFITQLPTGVVDPNNPGGGSTIGPVNPFGFGGGTNIQ